MFEGLEPDDLEIVVGGVEPTPGSYELMLAMIAELRSGPDHRAEVARARELLAPLGIVVPDRVDGRSGCIDHESEARIDHSSNLAG